MDKLFLMCATPYYSMAPFLALELYKETSYEWTKPIQYMDGDKAIFGKDFTVKFAYKTDNGVDKLFINEHYQSLDTLESMFTISGPNRMYCVFTNHLVHITCSLSGLYPKPR